jgi:predicted ABC-type transport system involved in lysophospholipase L1 biosynthesis ATPase subunit
VVFIGMHSTLIASPAGTALEIRGLRKRFTVGYGACLAFAEVLRGIDLRVGMGEVLSVVGGEASGKATLLLCAAGLLRADAGDVRWFGAASPVLAARRVIYHLTRTDLMRGGALGEPNLHLVDLADDSVREWVSARQEAGDAVILATRDQSLAESCSSRVMLLKRGVLEQSARSWPRVAEAGVAAR